MAGLYSLSIDARRDMVRMEFFGFFSAEEISTFGRARQMLRPAGEGHVTLVDMTGAQVQSDDAVTALACALTEQDARSRRIAFVLSRSSAPLRTEPCVGTGFFHSVEEAEDWLFAEGTRVHA